MKDSTESPMKILLVEDNPGDVRLIEEMLQDGEELLQRIEQDDAHDDLPHLHHEAIVSDGIAYIESNDVDVVLLDLNLPDSRGLDTLKSVCEATELLPILVLTGVDDRQIGIKAIQECAQDYLVKDEVTGDMLVRTIHHAIERNRLERERKQRQEQLETLNNLNQIAQDVTHILITTSSREKLEREICDRFASSDIYRFAWIGDVKRGNDQVTPRAAAGVEDSYLESISISIDDDETGREPIGRAVRTHEVQIVQNIETDPDYESWRAQANKYGYRSSATIPIVYEGVRYGVLNVYAGSSDAFSDPEVEILSRLGGGIGHAIAAIERKDALVSDAALELEFQVIGILDELTEFSAEQSGRIQIDNLAVYGDAVYAYGTASDISETEFRDAIDRADSVDSYRELPANLDDPMFRFEIVLSDARPLFETVAAHGGEIRSMTISGGELRVVMEYPRGTDTRQMITLLNERVASVSLLAQRTIERSDEAEGDPRSVLGNLTEKQREALETAYISGYFEWPRTSNASEIAERMGVSSATFTQHLRIAERKFFEAIFEETEGEETAADEIETDPEAPSE